MKRNDQRSSLFWLLLSIAIVIESLRLGIGTPRNPGMGFMSFGFASWSKLSPAYHSSQRPFSRIAVGARTDFVAHGWPSTRTTSRG